MKKLVSLLLTGLMAFSAVSAGAVSAAAATTDDEPAAVSFTAGSDIVFDNSQTKWPDVYIYSWGMGYYGDFVQMTPIGNDLYTAVAPVEVTAGTECFLFTSTTDWSGQQTPNIVTTEGNNTYKPIVTAGAITSVEQSATTSSTAPKVVATPNSKSFSDSLDVNLYAFNTTTAQYTVNDGDAVALNGSATLTLTASADIDILVDGTVAKSYEYTCVTVPDTEIFVTAVNADGTAYTGDMYVYTYGGDRLAPGFEAMVNEGDGIYSYTFKGTAHVIFTTTNDWATAVKFIIGDAATSDQEPLVTADGDNIFNLTLPAPAPTPAD